MLMKNVEQHSHFRGRFATFRVFFCQKMNILDAFVVSSFAKHICLTPRKAVFCFPKDGLSHGESLSFGSETYIFRKFKIAHLAYASHRVALKSLLFYITRIMINRCFNEQ